VIALSHEQLCDLPGSGRWHRHRRLVGLQLDERLSFGYLVAFVHQDLDDVAAFDPFCEKWEFDFHRLSIIESRRSWRA
jgi:hypothetical protein